MNRETLRTYAICDYPGCVKTTHRESQYCFVHLHYYKRAGERLLARRETLRARVEEAKRWPNLQPYPKIDHDAVQGSG